MKNLNIKKFGNGIIVLGGSALIYFASIILVSIFFISQDSLVDKPYEMPYELIVDGNNQKNLRKIMYSQKKVNVYDLNNKLIKSETYPPDANEKNSYLYWTMLMNKSDIYRLYTLPSPTSVYDGSNSTYEPVFWYFLPQSKYYIGYNRDTRRIIGYIGTNGFSTSLTETKIFENSYLQGNLGRYPQTYFIISEDKIFFINFKEQKINAINLNPNEKVISIMGENSFVDGKGENAKPQPVIVRTNKRIARYDVKGEMLSEISFQSDLDDKNRFSYLYNGNHYLCKIVTDKNLAQFLEAKEFSATGEILWEFKTSTGVTIKENNTLEYNIATIPFTLLISINLLNNIYKIDLSGRNLNEFMSLVFLTLNYYGVYFWTSFFILISCLVFVYFHLKTRTDSKLTLYGWLMTVAIFSIPGLITYLTFYAKTKTIECNYCHQHFAPINGSCLSCLKEIPSPKMDGREIFDVG